MLFTVRVAGVYVGSLVVQVRPGTDEDAVLRSVQALFAPYVRHLTVQVQMPMA